MNSAIRSVIAAGVLIAASALSLDAGLAAPARQASAGSTARAEAAHSLVTRLRQRVPELMAQAGVQGVQIAVLSGGKTAWHASFGLANADTTAPVTDASVFEAASLSKPVFAYAVLTLVDAGLLDLDTIEVFKQNVADHPDSWNVHDSLGEAYATDANTALAIQAYERSLQLNPANTGGAEALKKLRAVVGRD